MGLIVVDASVAVKWVLEEPGSVEAVNLLAGGDRLHAPDLVTVEVTGAITRAFRNDRLNKAGVETALDAWADKLRDNTVELVPNDLYLRRAAEISCALRHPIPDCLYLALAKRLGAELVTADGTFAGRATAVWPRVRPLGA